VGIGRLEDDVALKTVLARTQDFVNRAVAGPVIEHTRATANRRLRVESEHRGHPRREVVVVDEDVLPVVAQAWRYRKPPADADLVLDERAEHFLQEEEIPVAALLHE